MRLGHENERLIAALLSKGGPTPGTVAIDHSDAEVVAKKLRAWGSALSWLATHDISSVAGARRAQTIAARALYHEEAPDE